MTRRVLLAIALLALAASARAQETSTCAVARDKQLVSPAGIWHLLDPKTGNIHRWSLFNSRRATSLRIGAGAQAFAFLQARRSFVIARSSPARLTLRSQEDRAVETPFAVFDEELGEICGLGATDTHVVVCLDHTLWVVLDAFGHPVSSGDVGDLPEPTDPNAPVAHSWDAMVWDGVTQTMFAMRTQQAFNEALAVPVASGGLGEPEVAELGTDPNTPGPSLGDESLTLTSNGSRLIAPDGLEITTDPLAIDVLPEDADGEAFTVGDDVFHVAEGEDADCALFPGELDGASETLLHPGLIRSAQWNGRTWLLRGEAATAKLQLLGQAGDLDRDRAPDASDFFPLDPTTSRDWDHDGVEDRLDAAPTSALDFQDSDGDHVGDNADAFPENPLESKDTDGDHVGDHADAFPDDPNESLDTDFDGVGDKTDAFPFDPLEQADADDDGFGDNGQPFPTNHSRTNAFFLDLQLGVRLEKFGTTGIQTPALLELFDDRSFRLTLPGREPFTGAFVFKGKSGRTLGLSFDIRSLSQLELEFAAAATALVAQSSTPTPLPFVPKSVASSGVAKLTKTGVTLTQKVRLTFQREERFGPAWRGAFVFRAKGTLLPP